MSMAHTGPEPEPEPEPEPKASKKRSYYTHPMLRIYDWGVLYFHMAFAWGCSTESTLIPLFRDNFSKRHLDIGVATGYFPATTLERARERETRGAGQDPDQHITLVDLERSPLESARARILRVAPGTDVVIVQADILQMLPRQLQGVKFESISLFNVFHCVPGTGGEKAGRVLRTYKEVLADNGVVAGCTILGRDNAKHWFSRLCLKWWNFYGAFHNLEDREDDFVGALHDSFDEVETWTEDMMLLFRAGKPRRS